MKIHNIVYITYRKLKKYSTYNTVYMMKLLVIDPFPFISPQSKTNGFEIASVVGPVCPLRGRANIVECMLSVSIML